ncbi:MFS transporter [Sphingomonas crocodyli]|uniref:MFS transporter n=1 Tax=Sphingomonas crocodyli TaxID=1979270 RepID=A0A437M012_9SPHN|nr:MFS transporter [Sphingomonas crocodyli]RVT90844.1 MFS transporter [Sphingomonas crocodyli]
MNEDGLPQPRRLLAIIALSMGTALTTIDGAIATVALPTIARDLHVDGSAAVLVVTVYQLTLLMTMLPCAGIGDRIGLKRFYQYGQMLFAISTILCFFAKSLPFLLVVRAMQGLGAAATLSMMAAMIRNIYPSSHLGRGLGVNSVVASSSAALAPTLGGFILLYGQWPWVFAAAVPFAILSLILGRHALPDIPPSEGKFDLVGSVYNVIVFGLLIFGLEGLVHGDSPIVSLAVMGVGVLVAIRFVKHELQEERPILPVDLFASKLISLSIAGALLVFMANVSLTLSMPFRLQHLYGFTPAQVGAVMTPMPLTLMVMAPISATLADKLNAGILGASGMFVFVIGLLLMAFLPVHPTSFDVAWRMAVCGVGVALYLPTNVRLVMAATPRDRAAAAGGLTSTTRMTGQTLGATMVAALLAIGIGDGRAPVLIAAAFAVIGGLFSLGRIKLGKPGQSL